MSRRILRVSLGNATRSGIAQSDIGSSVTAGEDVVIGGALRGRYC